MVCVRDTAARKLVYGLTVEEVHHTMMHKASSSERYVYPDPEDESISSPDGAGTTVAIYSIHDPDDSRIRCGVDGERILRYRRIFYKKQEGVTC